jgi:beta-xylosidase
MYRRELIKGLGYGTLASMAPVVAWAGAGEEVILNGAAAQLPYGTPVTPSGRFTWQNPIRKGIPGGIRDAQIFRWNDQWHMIGGTPPFWEGVTPGVRLLSSDNLTEWHSPRMILERKNMAEDAWYRDRFWAPELHRIRGLWFLMVNCRNEDDRYKARHGGLVAVSENFDGPYEILTTDAPLMYGNDLTFFEDDDGQTYAFWNVRKTIQGGRLDVGRDYARIIGTPWDCFYTGGHPAWDSVGIEGAYVIKRRGIYYLFYSSWSRGYEIGYATATHPRGPWTKHSGNPIYGAQSRSATTKWGIPYSGDENQAFRAVGHNEVFTGPDGNLWISCHGILKGDAEDHNVEIPGLVIEPIRFKGDAIVIDGPTFTPQTVTW